MENSTKQQIMAAVEQFLTTHGMTATDLAKRAGVNNTYLSTMRQGQTQIGAGQGNMVDIADRYYEMLAKYIDFKLTKTYWQTVPTTQFKQIISTLEDAREYGATNVVIGETGSGKTFVSKIFQRKYPMDCFVVKVGSSDNLGDLIEKICEAVGSVTIEKTKSKTLRAIVKRLQLLKMDGFKPTVIFDEAEYMKQPALCNLKELYDALNGTCSLVLMGTEQLSRNIEKMRRKNRDGIPQLYRRIKFGYRPLNSIDRTYKLFFATGVYSAEVMRFLRENCENYGELHDVLVPALREADRSGQELTVELIRTMLNMPNI
jgi:DNA transposition AAA+ family ATPase